MRFPSRSQVALAIAFCCASAVTSAQAGEADFARCSSGDEPHVTCFNGIGNWGCTGPCGGRPVTVFVAPSGYHVCKALMTRRDIRGGECFFTGGPSELQMVCTAPDASAHARVQEITVYLVSANAPSLQNDKYNCIRW